jgi:hypothetical protein
MGARAFTSKLSGFFQIFQIFQAADLSLPPPRMEMIALALDFNGMMVLANRP